MSHLKAPRSDPTLVSAVQKGPILKTAGLNKNTLMGAQVQRPQCHFQVGVKDIEKKCDVMLGGL